MYEPPIQIFQTPIKMAEQINIQMDRQVIEAICSVGINVNKDELIKAMNYDRQQYEKGYTDGVNASRWIPVSEKLPNTEGYYLATYQFLKDDGTKTPRMCHEIYYADPEIEMWVFDEDCDWENEETGFELPIIVHAWMPLPDKYVSE